MKISFMKKPIIILLLAAVVLTCLGSCKKLVDTFFAGETITMPALSMTVPAIPIADSTLEIQAGSFTTYINVDSTIKANTSGVFGIKDVSTVYVKQVTISVTNADEFSNLSAFKNFRITIASNTKTSPSDMLVVNIPASAYDSYTENPSNPTNIVDYLHGSSIDNTVYGSARKTTLKSLQVSVVITLFAK
jgi:hypothetical protein